jgi:hypothetical protein
MRAHRGRRAIVVLAVGGLIAALTAAGTTDVAGGQAGPEISGSQSAPSSAPSRGNPDVALGNDQLRQAVADLVDDGQATTSADVDVEDGGVRVEILHHTTDAEIDRIVAAHRGTIDGRVPGVLVEGVVPPANLEALEAEDAVDVVQPPLPVDEPTALLAGSVTGEEVVKTNADDWQTQGIDGTGVKVGIIDSFGTTSWNNAQGSGDVPAPAGTVCRSNGATCNVFDAGQNHGVGVAEIIHDMAPGAQLYLGSASSTADTQAVVDYFHAQGVDIISRSLTSPYDGPGNGTGPLATVIDNAVADGMAFMQSAANAAGLVGVRLGSYYRFTYSDSTNDGWVDVGPGGDELLGFNCGFLNGLRWDDFGAANPSDYDLYIFDTVADAQAGTWLARSTIGQGSGFPGALPIERTTNCNGVDYAAIWRFAANNGTTGDVFEFGTNSTGLEYWQNPRSASGPGADTRNPGAITVGAIDPANGTTIAEYSSQGPTNDGRVKPDLSAAACVQSVAFSPSCFSGTSAATPVVAGAAALVIDSGAATAPAAVHNWLLCAATVERGVAGIDNVYGVGELILPTTFPVSTRACRPDARIRAGTGPVRGNNVYNAQGGTNQTVTRTGGANANLTYTTTFENDGREPERFRLQGTRSTTRFTVTYKAGATNITTAVGNGTYQTPLVNPGATFTVTVTVKVKANTVRNQAFTGKLTARSSIAPSIVDAVKFVAKRT